MQRRLALVTVALLVAWPVDGQVACRDDDETDEIFLIPRGDQDPADYSSDVELAGAGFGGGFAERRGVFWTLSLPTRTRIDALHVEIVPENLCMEGLCLPRPRAVEARPRSLQPGAGLGTSQCVAALDVQLKDGRFFRVGTDPEKPHAVAVHWTEPGEPPHEHAGQTVYTHPIADDVETVNLELTVDPQYELVYRDSAFSVPLPGESVSRDEKLIRESICAGTDNNSGHLCSCVNPLLRWIQFSCYTQAARLPFEAVVIGTADSND